MSTLRDRRDPIQRWLRILSTLAFLGLVIIVVLDPNRRDVSLTALLSGVVLLQLGYEIAIPGLARREERKMKNSDEDDSDAA